MKILLILGHPKPGSFNHVIADLTVKTLREAGHEVVCHDLYCEHFDPVLPADEDRLPEDKLPDYLKQYINEFREAQGLIFVHPNWWGSPPAILRGWIERIIRTGSCYHFTKDGVVSYVGGKDVQIFSTSNTPHDVEINIYGDPVDRFWRVIVFGLLGSQSFERRNFDSVILSTQEERENWLSEVVETVKRRFGNV
jgi:putative NADPH-quinone reductase